VIGFVYLQGKWGESPIKIKVMLKVNDLVSVFGRGNNTFVVKRIQGKNVLIQGAKGATTTVHFDDCIKKTFTVV